MCETLLSLLEKDTETLRGSKGCLRSHSYNAAEQIFESKVSDPEGFSKGLTWSIRAQDHSLPNQIRGK